MSSFHRLHPGVQHHVVNTLGWRDLRPVQEQTITAVLDGQNPVVLAPTAGGKTEAAFFPILSQTATEDWAPLSVLYISPIRALLNNQEERLRRYYGWVGRTMGVWHGDVSGHRKKGWIAEPPDLLMTTPESIEGVLVSRVVDQKALFENLRAVVIDEVHAFAGDDRGWHLLCLLERLQQLCGRDLQRIGLSATVGNAEELAQWLCTGSSRATCVVDPGPNPDAPEPKVELDFVGSLANAATVIARLHHGEKRLVFVDSRSRAEELARLLREVEVQTYVTHSSLGLDERRQAEKAFAEGQNCVIVATSALELGIDVGDLDRVIQIDAPGTVSSFLQRMGRTGRRAGSERSCLFLATREDAALRAAALLRLWKSGFVEPARAQQCPYGVLLQQTLGIMMQEKQVNERVVLEQIGETLQAMGITPDDVGEVIEHLVSEGLLARTDGWIWFTERGEQIFGRKNFLEILSVFVAPPELTVFQGRKEVGRIHEINVRRPVGESGGFSLGGRSWKVRSVDWRRRTVQVEPLQGKARSVWQGGEVFLSREMTESMRQVLADDVADPEWTPRAIDQLSALREDRGEQAAQVGVLHVGEAGCEWRTWLGGRLNAALAAWLQAATGIEVGSDNVAVRSLRSFAEAVPQFREAWQRDGLRVFEGVELPESDKKFEEYLPVAVALRLRRERLVDSLEGGALSQVMEVGP